LALPLIGAKTYGGLSSEVVRDGDNPDKTLWSLHIRICSVSGAHKPVL
jgi:hypothetical protein